MTTFVLVPGMCHGGWCFDDLAAELRAAGHTVDAVTLTSVGDPTTPPDPAVDLAAHVADVVRALDAAIGPVVLAGHSYGGLPMTVAADRRPAAVDALVYLDAFVPRDGETARAMTNDHERAWYDEARASGLVPRMPFFDARATDHPLATLEQPAELAAGLEGFRKRVYLYATQWGELASPFAATLARLRDDPSWEVHELDAAHNLMRDAPDALRDVLLDAAA
ncbi:esterase [Actinomycetospora sp. NBRC 106375]|uniref:alpha/beta fold hydrolase n=1 Tax=Actinomycetospora sp. NBRC 106375 TaxID=3032207 RepID=UPI0024A33AAE|nr:alpha/beta fold hydrolase [Actinomycetospora sp. NBRC 106375]GLZ45072.1 esterase [Actinomycetospora sp. NBRC 106375]